jgi:hypothetical protein
MTADVPDRLEAGLRLLDRQIVDRHEQPVAKVDDLELTIDHDGRPYVSALLCGPGAWGPRVGGRLGNWIAAVWYRQHPHASPTPIRIPIVAMSKLDAAVHLDVDRETTGTQALADWLATHVIAPIPGAEHDSE